MLPVTDTSAPDKLNLKTDNHYVPRIYLKRWANADHEVNTYRILVPHEKMPLWKRQSTKGLAYHKHLYTRVMATGETDDIETWLDREFEAPAEEPLQKVASGAQLTPDDWEAIIRFAAAQDVRTPTRLLEITGRANSPEMSQFFQATLESAVKNYETAIRAGRPIQRTPTTGAEYLPIRVTTGKQPDADQGFIKAELVVGRGYWQFAMRHLLSTTLKALLEHRWTLLRPPPPMR